MSAQSKVKKFEFSDDQIDSRITDHWELAEHFSEAMLQERTDLADCSVQLVVNRRRMKLVVASAYQDIARYKNYHQVDPWGEKLDCVKRSAYLLKWVTKIKPLQLVGDDGLDVQIDNEAVDDFEAGINERFALSLFEVHLSDELGVQYSLSEKKIGDLLYDLVFREISVDGWIAIFQMFKDCCSPVYLEGAPFIDKL